MQRRMDRNRRTASQQSLRAIRARLSRAGKLPGAQCSGLHDSTAAKNTQSSPRPRNGGEGSGVRGQSTPKSPSPDCPKASRVRKYPGARQQCRRRQKGCTQTPADCRPRLAFTPGYRTQREGARARKPELRNHKQASRVRKYPGAQHRCRHRQKGCTHTPADCRPRLAFMPGYRTQREWARAGKPELRNHKQASRVRKYPGAQQQCRHRQKGCKTHTRGLPSAARLMHRNSFVPIRAHSWFQHDTSSTARPVQNQRLRRNSQPRPAETHSISTIAPG